MFRPEQIYSFTDWAVTHPNQPVPGDRVDAQFENHRHAIQDLIDGFSGVFNADGSLKNSTVTLASLDPSLVANLMADITSQTNATLTSVASSLMGAQSAAITANQARADAVQAAAQAQLAALAVNSEVNNALTAAGAVAQAIVDAQAMVDAALAQMISTRDSAESYVGTSEAWALASQSWAENMPGEIPPDILGIMGITGQHWSSRWWANQAAQDADFIEGNIQAALDAATAAQAAAAEAAAAADQLTDLYLGAKSSNPTTDNDGNALQVGAMYFNTATHTMMVWSGSVWQSLATAPGSITAAGTSFAPAGGIAATNVQTAIQELDTEKIGFEPQDGGTYGRKSGAWVSVLNPTVDWGNITGKPSTFPPSAHTHPISDVVGLQPALDAKADDTDMAAEISARSGADSVLQADINTRLQDAPSDGTTYGRKDATWSPTASAAASGTAGEWVFNATTSAPPASGQIRLNQSAPATATTIWISDTNANGVDVGGVLTQKLKQGVSIYLQDSGNSTNWALFKLSSDAVDAGAYHTCTVTYVGGAGTLTPNGRVIALDFPASTLVAIGDTPPSNALTGSLWWESDTGALYLRYDDGNSKQWVQVGGGGGGGASVVVSPTAPPSPVPGNIWWDSDSGNLYLRYDDGNSQQWVQINYGPTPANLVQKAGDTMTGSLILAQAQPPAPLEAINFDWLNKLTRFQTQKNILYNGDFSISQKAAYGVMTGTGVVFADGWQFSFLGGAITAQALYVTPSSLQQGRYRGQFKCTTAKGSLAAGDISQVYHYIEGVDIAAARWGNANAVPLVLRFGFKAPAGVYGISFANPAVGTAYYMTTFTVAAGDANVDKIYTLSIPPPPVGATWVNGNNTHCIFRITLAAGTTYQGTPGWGTANVVSTSAQFNFMASTANVAELFDVRLLIDFDSLGAGFDPGYPPQDWQTETTRCQRYYQKLTTTQSFFQSAAGEGQYRTVTLKTVMRAAPVCTEISPGTKTNVAAYTATALSGGEIAYNLVGVSTASLAVSVASNIFEFDAQMP